MTQHPPKSRIPRVLEPEVMDTLEEAQSYDIMDHSAPNAAFVERLMQLGIATAPGTGSSRMLDIGTGPGHIPLLICARVPGANIVAIDLSRHMLDIARRHLAASPFQERIEFRGADAKALPFPDASFDVVFSNTILHHIPDPRPFLREAKRVLQPRGVFLIRDLFRPDSRARADELVALHAPGATLYQQQLLRQSLLAALTSDELRDMAGDVGMRPAQGFEVVVDTDRHMSLQKYRG